MNILIFVASSSIVGFNWKYEDASKEIEGSFGKSMEASELRKIYPEFEHIFSEIDAFKLKFKHKKRAYIVSDVMPFEWKLEEMLDNLRLVDIEIRA